MTKQLLVANCVSKYSRPRNGYTKQQIWSSMYTINMHIDIIQIRENIAQSIKFMHRWWEKQISTRKHQNKKLQTSSLHGQAPCNRWDETDRGNYTM